MVQNQRNVLILFFTMIVIMLGFGIVIPILPFYVKQFGAGGSALGMLMATYGLMQFIFAPIWGSISDQIGRKPILMVGVFGNALAQLLLGLSTQLWMLFVARALAGILSSATLPTAMAYVSDSTSEEERGGKMGMIGAAMGIGMVIGPGLGGWLASSSLSAPFFLASGLSFLALIIVFLVLPEAPRSAPNKDIRIRGPQIQNLWKALTGPIGLLFWMAFLLSFGLTNFESVFGLYAKERYNYTPQQVGTILTVIGLISALIQGGLTGPATRKFGEIKVIQAAFISSAIGFVLMTLAQNYVQVMLTAGYFVLSNAMLNPSVASLISKNTSTKQGITMGLNNSFLSLGRIIGPMWAGSIFDLNIHYPYFSGSVIMVLGFLMSLAWSRREVALKFNPEIED